MISLFLVFKAMESQGNFMVEPYDLREYKLTWMRVVTFSALHVYFIYIKHTYFATLFCKNVCQLIR
jgi:hypothetical protein